MKDIGLDLIDHHVLSVFSLHSIYTGMAKGILPEVFTSKT